MLQENLAGKSTKVTQPSTRESAGQVRSVSQQAGHPILQLQRELGNRLVSELVGAGRLSTEGLIFIPTKVGVEATENKHDCGVDRGAPVRESDHLTWGNGRRPASNASGDVSFPIRAV